MDVWRDASLFMFCLFLKRNRKYEDRVTSGLCGHCFVFPFPCDNGLDLALHSLQLALSFWKAVCDHWDNGAQAGLMLVVKDHFLYISSADYKVNILCTSFLWEKTCITCKGTGSMTWKGIGKTTQGICGWMQWFPKWDFGTPKKSVKQVQGIPSNTNDQIFVFIFLFVRQIL